MRELRRQTIVLAVALASALAGLSCDDVGDQDPPDFFITVKLHTSFLPRSVDRLEVVLFDATMTLEDMSGEAQDGGIRWETRDGDRADEFAVNLTGEYFRANAVEVSRDTWEIDLPFIGGQEEGAFNLRASVYWIDPDGEEQEIGFGTGHVEFPLSPQGSGVAVEVNCRDGWAWTCQTGCDGSVQPCGGIEDCGSGFWECVDGCCVEQD